MEATAFDTGTRHLQIPQEQIPKGFCQCGCGAKTRIAARSKRKRGEFRGKPFRCLIGHKRRKAKKLSYDVAETGCWLWNGGKNGSGYGTIYLPGTGSVYAHRYFYEHFIGKIPAGLEIDHLCKTRECVNPGHLEAVTHEENMRRKEADGLNRYGK